VRQSVYTCVAPLSSAGACQRAVHGLKVELAARQRAGDDQRALDALGRIHCARVVVLDAARSQDGHYFGPRLVVSTWHDDEDTATHLRQLSQAVPELLGSAFERCAGYVPSARPAERGARVQAFLHAHRVAPAAAYNSARLRSVDQIRKEAALVRRFEAELESASKTTASADELFESLLAEARRDAGLRWAFEPPARCDLPRTERVARWIGWIVKTAPHWLRFFASLRALRESERLAQRRNADAERALAAAGRVTPAPHQAGRDHTSNAYNSVSVVLPGAVRNSALRMFLSLLETVGSHRQDLSGITSMRFAHWSLIDGDRRLLFCSMYDGAWESYMADFIDLAGWGLTGVWSNTEGYPATDFLVLNGARDEQGFRGFVRRREVATDFWYRGYAGISGENVQDNTKIRRGLSSALTVTERRAWLSLL
jgi:hypothetical protein